jgi:hypothetical protein
MNSVPLSSSKERSPIATFIGLLLPLRIALSVVALADHRNRTMQSPEGQLFVV